MWESILSIIGSIASIFGLGITIVVARRVNSIRKEYLLIGRGPVLAGKLFEEASRLPNLWGNVEGNHEEIVMTLGNAEVSLRSAERSLDGDLKQTARRLRRYVRELQGLSSASGFFPRRSVRPSARTLTHDEVFGLYNEPIKFVDNVREDIENQRWVR
jgi:hypothetical protein